MSVMSEKEKEMKNINLLIKIYNNCDYNILWIVFITVNYFD